MKLRSLLFVPGDSDRKFVKASGIGADALILDLEDSVAPALKDAARAATAEKVSDTAPHDWQLFVRINPFDSGLSDADLAAVVRPGLDGIMLPKAEGADDVARVAATLDRLEAAAGMAAGSVKLVVIATETPRALFTLASYTPPHPRLAGLTWGAEDLAAAVGASANREVNAAGQSSWTFPYQVARAAALFAASAAGVAPLDTLFADFRDGDGLARDCVAARRDGFVGRLAIHPDQVAIINTAFSPGEADLAHARKIVAAFAANPQAGTLGVDGKMVDIPHLKAALRTLAAAGEATA
jgi:citrate lyase subunit beta / citryl-CoA lyase